MLPYLYQSYVFKNLEIIIFYLIALNIMVEYTIKKKKQEYNQYMEKTKSAFL